MRKKKQKPFTSFFFSHLVEKKNSLKVEKNIERKIPLITEIVPLRGSKTTLDRTSWWTK